MFLCEKEKAKKKEQLYAFLGTKVVLHKYTKVDFVKWKMFYFKNV